MGEREVRGKAPGLSVSAVVLSEGEAKRVRVEGTCDLDDVEMKLRGSGLRMGSGKWCLIYLHRGPKGRRRRVY
jgi:hypothetical protein